MACCQPGWMVVVAILLVFLSMFCASSQLQIQNSIWTECPDNGTVCPIASTCCNGPEKTMYGCCDGRNSVCCSDKHHCCPEHHVCTKTYCERTLHTTARKTHKGDKLYSPRTVVCPDGKTTCPNANTCCFLATGSYGCCNLPEATCCSDKRHCCPKGYSCSPHTDKCVRNDALTQLYTFRPQLVLQNNIICPDNVTVCTMNETCCELPNKSWACCPTPEAKCCGLTCCPKDYKCDDKNCKKEVEHPLYKVQYKMHEIVAAEIISGLEGQNLALNDPMKCDIHQTSCRLSLGEYGCCPGKHATCCSDGKHCCPYGYNCKLKGMCERK